MNFKENLFKKILTAVSFLHKNKIVHGDIKLSNIMIDIKGNIKIIDFGFSSYINSSKKLIKCFAGSPVYMSPEIVMQNPFDGKIN